MLKHVVKLTTLVFLFFTTVMYGQQGSLSVKINKDTIAVDEVVTIEFMLDNLSGNFRAPDFMGFQVVSGPNTSSSFRMINGEVSQKKSYSYALVPLQEGSLSISPASVENNGNVISTEEIEIFVSKKFGSKKSSSMDRTFIYDNDNPRSQSTQKKKRPLKKI